MPKYDVKVTACYEIEAADPFEAVIKAVDIDMRPQPWHVRTEVDDAEDTSHGI